MEEAADPDDIVALQPIAFSDKWSILGHAKHPI
jgi:hypothetical protein